MKLPYRESFAYYASCMILLNVIYLIRMVGKGILCPNIIDWENSRYICDFITFCSSGLFAIVGVIATFWMCLKNDTIKQKSSKGIQVYVLEMHDDTSDNFFSKFSLLVLTGLTLPACEGAFSLIIFLLIFISLGLVYTDKNLIYINPLLSLLHYNVYRCKCLQDEKLEREYCFFKRGKSPILGRKFSFQNVGHDRMIIRLQKEIKYDEEQKQK